MQKERPFDIARPRVPKDAARSREKIMMEKMTELLAERDEESFKKNLEIAFGIKPGSPPFDAALKAWREASSSL
jgi:hypothetical protein